MLGYFTWEYLQTLLPADILTLSWNFAVILAMFSLVWWKVFLPREEQTTRADETRAKACTSPNCVRCSNYVFLRERLLERFFVLKESDSWRESTDKSGQERLENAIERYHPGRIQGVQLVPQRPTVFHFPGLVERPWFDDEYDHELAILKEEMILTKIKSEFENVYSNFKHTWTTNRVPEGKWETFYFINQGINLEENLSLCPETTKLLNQIKPLMRGCAFGNALFSVLHRHTHIEPHYGPTNIRIRCHIPLIIPGGCKLVVAGEGCNWREGELILFDDSFLHEAWHKGCSEDKEPRVVFMMDLWHPDLSVFERDCLGYLFKLQ